MSDYDRLKLLSGEEASRLPASLYVDAAEVQERVQAILDGLFEGHGGPRGASDAPMADELLRLIKELEP